MSTHNPNRTIKGQFVCPRCNKNCTVLNGVNKYKEGVPWLCTRCLHLDPIPQTIRTTDGRTFAQALQDAFTPGHPDNNRTPRFDKIDPLDPEEYRRDVEAGVYGDNEPDWEGIL